MLIKDVKQHSLCKRSHFEGSCWDGAEYFIQKSCPASAESFSPRFSWNFSCWMTVKIAKAWFHSFTRLSKTFLNLLMSRLWLSEPYRELCQRWFVESAFTRLQWRNGLCECTYPLASYVINTSRASQSLSSSRDCVSYRSYRLPSRLWAHTSPGDVGKLFFPPSVNECSPVHDKFPLQFDSDYENEAPGVRLLFPSV